MAPGPAYAFPIPGEISAPEYGLSRIRGERAQDGLASASAFLRPWKAGDRVTLRHSRGPKKVAEVLDRLHVVGEARKNWPVVEWEGRDHLDARGRSGCARIYVYCPIVWPEDQRSPGNWVVSTLCV